MAENSPKSRHLRYQEVIVRILEYIRKNEIPPEGRLPSEREWMSQWKVSQPTVNKAVACLMAEGRLRREGYRLFVANQDEIRPQTPPIHVLCPHVEYQRTVLVQHDLVEAAHDTAAIFHGQITPRLAKTPAEQRLHVAQLLREKVAGFLIWPISNASLEDLFVQCQASGIPFVICDADIGRFDYVGIDNEIGVRLALAHLIALGHRQIAYLTDRPRLSPSLQRRVEGYQQGCFSLGVKTSMKRIIEVPTISLLEAGQAMEALLNRFPEVTAVFCSNDRLALHALEYAVGRGIKVPEDLSFVGFDNIDASALCSPALTTINQDFYNMGLVAAETLYRRIRSHSAANQPCPQRLRLEPSLLVRASSSRPRTEPLVARKSQRSKLTPPP